jgi:hypothetical protein
MKSSVLTGNVADHNTSPVIAVSTVDAMPLWAALFQSLNLMHAEDYEYRRLWIWEISSRCDRLIMMGNYMN